MSRSRPCEVDSRLGLTWLGRLLVDEASRQDQQHGTRKQRQYRLKSATRALGSPSRVRRRLSLPTGFVKQLLTVWAARLFGYRQVNLDPVAKAIQRETSTLPMCPCSTWIHYHANADQSCLRRYILAVQRSNPSDTSIASVRRGTVCKP